MSSHFVGAHKRLVLLWSEYPGGSAKVVELFWAAARGRQRTPRTRYGAHDLDMSVRSKTECHGLGTFRSDQSSVRQMQELEIEKEEMSLAPTTRRGPNTGVSSRLRSNQDIFSSIERLRVVSNDKIQCRHDFFRKCSSSWTTSVTRLHRYSIKIHTAYSKTKGQWQAPRMKHGRKPRP